MPTHATGWPQTRPIKSVYCWASWCFDIETIVRAQLKMQHAGNRQEQARVLACACFCLFLFACCVLVALSRCMTWPMLAIEAFYMNFYCDSIEQVHKFLKKNYKKRKGPQGHLATPVAKYLSCTMPCSQQKFVPFCFIITGWNVQEPVLCSCSHQRNKYYSVL